MDNLYRGSNPMRAAGDIILGDTNGRPKRLPQGPPNSLFGVDAAGVLGYQTNTGSSFAMLVDWKENADLYSGSTWTGGVAQPIGGVKNFTVQAASSLIQITASVGVFNTSAPAAIAETQSYLIVDGSMRFELGSSGSDTTGNPFAGAQPVNIVGLAAGVHTAQVFAWSNSTSTGWYLRAASQPTLEHYTLQIVEYKVGVGAIGPQGPAGSGMANPMTLVDDIIVGLGAGVPGRKAKGAVSTVWSVNAAGVLGYRRLASADFDAGIITPAMHSNPPVIRLNYNQSSNVFSNTLVNAGTYDLMSGQGFTVGVSSSLLILSTYGMVYYTNATGGAACHIQLTASSGGTPFAIWYIAAQYEHVANGAESLNWAASVPLSLASGTYSLSVQISVYQNSTTLYFDPGSTNLRKGGMFVTEYA